jgi:hypothetical protein
LRPRANFALPMVLGVAPHELVLVLLATALLLLRLLQ